MAPEDEQDRNRRPGPSRRPESAQATRPATQGAPRSGSGPTRADHHEGCAGAPGERRTPHPAATYRGHRRRVRRVRRVRRAADLGGAGPQSEDDRPHRRPRSSEGRRASAPVRTKSWGNVARRGAARCSGETTPDRRRHREGARRRPRPSRHAAAADESDPEPEPAPGRDLGPGRRQPREWSDSAPRQRRNGPPPAPRRPGRGAQSARWPPARPPRGTGHGARRHRGTLGAAHPPAAAGARRRDPQCGGHGHRVPPGAPGGAGRVGLRSPRAGPRPRCAAGDQARGRGGARPLPACASWPAWRRTAVEDGARPAPFAGLRHAHRLDRASPRPDGLPARPAQAEEGGRAVERTPPELSRTRRAGRGPHRGGGRPGRQRRPQRRHRDARHRGRGQGAAQPVGPPHPPVVPVGRPLRAGRRPATGPRVLRARPARRPRGL